MCIKSNIIYSYICLCLIYFSHAIYMTRFTKHIEAFVANFYMYNVRIYMRAFIYRFLDIDIRVNVAERTHSFVYL